MHNKTILIIEDEEDIIELLIYNLQKNGYNCISATTGEEGLKINKNESPDLILLDLMLPSMSGFDICKKIRLEEENKKVPIIMLTARGEESDIVKGLELGADDYITKPFSPSVLVARIKNVLRRHSASVQELDVIKMDEMIINNIKKTVSIQNKNVNLTFNELKLLTILAKKPGWVMTRYQIVNLIRGEEYSVTDRAVDVMIVGLRKKLGDYGSYIETVRGVGYKFREY